MLFSNVTAQELGTPLAKHYLPSVYGAEPQVMSTLEAVDGMLYMGVGGGILEYDGHTWRKINLNGGTARSLHQAADGRIYVGGEQEFGYLERDEKGRQQFHNLLTPEAQDSIPMTMLVINIKSVENKIYFQAPQHIFEYHTENQKMYVYRAISNRFSGSFLFDNRYIVRDGADFFAFSQGKVSKLDMSAVFPNFKLPASVIASGEPYYFCINADGFLFYDSEKNTTIPLSEAHNDFMENNGVYESFFSDKDQSLILGSTQKGAALIDRQTGRLQHYDKKVGLDNNHVYAISENAQGDLWIGTSNGVAKADRGIALSYWNKNSGLPDIVESVLYHDSMVYITTHQDIYYLESEQPVEIQNKEDKGQSWIIKSFNINGKTKILVGTSRGIYAIEGKKANFLLPLEHVFDFYQSKKNPKHIYVAGGDAISLLAYREEIDRWGWTNTWGGLQDNIRGLVEDKEGNLWCGTFRNGAIKVVPNPDSLRNPLEIKYYREEQGFPSLKNLLPFHLGEEIVWGTEKGIYIYNADKDIFEPYEKLGARFGKDGQEVFDIQETPDGKIWICPLENKKGNEIGYLEPQKDGGYVWVSAPFKTIPEMFVVAFYIDERGIVWIGGSEGLFRYDPSRDTKNYEQKPQLTFREITIGKDSTLYWHAPSSTSDRITYDYNSIRFSYAAVSLTQEDKNTYRYRLVGFEDEWSDWSSAFQKEYSFLTEGSYRFEVRARNLYGVESEVRSYEFVVLPPWYRTWWAYLIYALLAAAGVYGLIVWNNRRLKRENERLEQVIQERTQEILLKNVELEQQKEEILVQSEGLQSANEEIQKQKEGIEKAYQNVSLLNNIGQQITAILDTKTLIAKVYEMINTLMPAEAFGIGVYESDEHKIHFEGFIENSEIMPSHYDRLEDPNSLAVWCFKHRKTIFINDFDTQHEQYISKRNLAEATPSQVGSHFNALIYEPLMLDQKCVGVVTVQSHQRNAYSESHKVLLTSLASYIAIAIDNAHNYGIMKANHQHITDAIRYGQTIQLAFLPSEARMNKLFPAHAIVFRPKDIVSGDFYWVSDKDDYRFIVLADCTGHGVPGAFMSMIGTFMLNKIINEKHYHEPAQILEQLDSNIQEALRQRENANDDGMDLILLRIKTNQNHIDICFAGAKQNLHTKAPNPEAPIVQHKGTRRSIGGRKLRKRPFEQHNLSVENGTTIYLFSDGIPDQHNSERRKIGSLNLIKKIQSLSTQPLNLQKEALHSYIDDFQGEAPQRDDMSWIAIRL
ncbi:MAG: SpoIIE family protein phosphatase [Bernardetiaceae bacterium]|nr:SpoIIE family protein phosphatase [Bernardetiaceae bacterium]